MLLVSVIIPNYNRQKPILRALNSLRQQTLSASQYEVIVVDDGSTTDTSEVGRQRYPFQFHFLRKQNEGATIARNYGVRHSQGRVLVFIDDDVTISEGALAALAAACLENEKVVAMGTLASRSNEESSLFTQDALAIANEGVRGDGRSPDQYRHFSHCNTQLLAVRRDHFFELGMLQDPTGGWPNWDDVDFGYRSHLAGFRLLQVGTAVGEHWDYSLADLGAACRRWQKAGQSAARLFQVHPGLQSHIPMFADKTPIDRVNDSPRLIIRKIVRALTSASVALWLLEKTVGLLEKIASSPKLLRPLYRWIQGGYMFRGYREGLNESV
ncbi:MAG: glycosyltransferase [Chloroflexi bacterium]|nr:glycosyltransferase [Chloroflexota bacterium]